TEVEDLNDTVIGQLDIRWLEVAVNDPFLVGGFEGLTNLLCDRQCFIDGDRSTFQPLLKRLSLNQLHHDARLRRRVFKAVNLGDIRMVQTGKNLSFALESCETLWIIGEVIRQEFQSDLTMQFGIKSPKHDTHAAFTER